MKLVKIAAGVLNQTPLDWTGNLENIVAAMEQARQQNVSILCLPELCITGYGCEDAFHSPGVEKTAHEMLLAVADAAHNLVVSVGLPLTYAGGLFNTAALIVGRPASSALWASSIWRETVSTTNHAGSNAGPRPLSAKLRSTIPPIRSAI